MLTMKLSKYMFGFLILFFLFSPVISAFAEEPTTTIGASKILILTPKPGEKIPAGQEVLLNYQLVHGLRDNGDHIHVYVDGESQGTAKRSPRSLGKLPPGKHKITLKVSNRDHDLVHVETDVEFEVSP
ncbi:MAG: hypothetical protein ACYDBV_07180 [Nitrospiria bacterium]